MNVVELVRTAWLVAGVYVLLGLAFAGVFLPTGLVRVDPGARGAGLAFRALILPGVVALWPVLAWRWWAVRNGAPQPVVLETPVAPESLRRWHAFVWMMLAVAGPILLAVSLVWRAPERYSGVPLLPVSSAGAEMPSSSSR